MDFWARFRAVNQARWNRWTDNAPVDILFTAVEIAEEGGEVAGAIKKLVRLSRGWQLKKKIPTEQDVKAEIGDVLTVLDRAAAYYGWTLEECAREKFNSVSDENGLHEFKV